MGAQMKRAGDDDFVILERNDRIGGVWQQNDYPGAACDTEAHLYCYSFHPHLRVSRMYAGREELLRYMESLVEAFGLAPHLRHGTEVLSARWQERERRWLFEVSGGAQYEAEFFVPAWGQLNQPHVPPFKGLEDFRGAAFHSARWDHGVDLDGKQVASIGNAASAVQYVPEIAPRVQHLTVFQRSANWIMPRNQIVFSQEQLDAFARDPATFQASRQHLHAFREAASSGHSMTPGSRPKVLHWRWHISPRRCRTRSFAPASRRIMNSPASASCGRTIISRAHTAERDA